MVVTCQIDFDNNQYGIYFAGQVVTGKVTLTADKPKHVRGVALKIQGYARTYWTERTSRTVTNSKGQSTSESRAVHFSGREEYISSLTYLVGSDLDQSHSIAPGIHTYTFACHLPSVCPSSFEGVYGHIRYFVKIALIRPWKFDQTFTKGFTVLKVMDLNYDNPALRIPAYSELEKVYCCGPCKSDPMKFEVTLPQSGFVPGQNIPITLTVTNDSNVPVQEIKVELFMWVRFFSQMPRTSRKVSKVSVSKLKGEGVLRNCKKVFNYEMPVPATPPTCHNLCRIIHISYELCIEAKVKGMHANQMITVPITIGNVPLMGVIQNQPTASMQKSLHSNDTGSAGIQLDANVIATAPTDIEPWSSHSNIPPPNYEEAMHVPHARINEDEKHDFGESDFAPRYPVFNMANVVDQPMNNDEIDGNKTTNGTWL